MKPRLSLFAFLLLALLMTVLPFPAGSAAPGKSARQYIETMVDRLRKDANVSEIEMTIQRPNWSRALLMNAWDERARHRVFIRILKPPKEQGTTFLRLGDNLWSYLPKVEKVLKIPPSMMLQPWMGSDFTNDDLMKESSYTDDYDHQIAGREERDGEKLVRIELTPHPNAPVVWGKVIFWLRENDSLPVQQHFLDEKGNLIKDLRFSDFKKMDGSLIPTRWEIVPVTKEGQKTILRILTIDFDPSPPIPESVFTEKNLRT